MIVSYMLPISCALNNIYVTDIKLIPNGNKLVGPLLEDIVKRLTNSFGSLS